MVTSQNQESHVFRRGSVKIEIEGTIGYRWHGLFLKAEIINKSEVPEDIQKMAKEHLYAHQDELMNKRGFRCVKMDYEKGTITHTYVHNIKGDGWTEFEFKEERA